MLRSGAWLLPPLFVLPLCAQEAQVLPNPAEPPPAVDTITPVPRAAAHVAGLSALRSRVLTVIDCMRSLELGTADRQAGILEGAVVELDGHHYALIVDSVDDVRMYRSVEI